MPVLAPRRFIVPELVFGKGSLDLAGRYARAYEARQVLLVTDPGVTATGCVDRVRASLEETGAEVTVFDGVSPNPRAAQVAAGLERCLGRDCDLVVAVGGGSPMDCAKGIAVCATNGGSILDYEGIDRIALPSLPLICVPTTAGSAADQSQFAVINDVARKVKIVIASKKLVPDLALVDPATTASMGPALTAATGMDALCHAAEAYVSLGAGPLTDLPALKAASLVAANLRRACDDGQDEEAREGMALACLFAGQAFSNASLGLVHAMAHALGGLLDAPHGLCNALLLDQAALANAPAAAARYDDLARALGEEPRADDAAGEAFARAVRRLREGLRMGTGLRALGATEDDIPRLAANASRDPCLATNPRPMAADEIAKVYARAL